MSVHLKDVVCLGMRWGAGSFPYCFLIWFCSACRLLLLFGFLLPLIPCAGGWEDQDLLGNEASLRR